MTTPHTSGAADLPAIQRYKIGYHSDDWGQRSSTPSGIPDALGSWVRYADHVAALVAGQAVAQPVRTWCDGCSPENCGGCHIPSNAATPAQAPSQLGGFSAGDMASTAAQGYRDGWTAAQADSVLEDAVPQVFMDRGWHDVPASDLWMYPTAERWQVRTLYFTPQPTQSQVGAVPLTAKQLEAGRDAIFSTGNPYCPCDSKTFRKVAEWVELHHGIKEGGQHGT